MTNFLNLPAFDGAGLVHVVVESPKGASAKLKYEPKLGAFTLSRPLALGLVYPFDWGFVPSTAAPDGDPLDGMILNDVPTATGVVVVCKPLALLQVEQTQAGMTMRNDRILFKPEKAPRLDAIADAEAIPERIRREVEAFFQHAVLGTGKMVRFLGWCDAAQAGACIGKGADDFAAKEAQHA